LPRGERREVVSEQRSHQAAVLKEGRGGMVFGQGQKKEPLGKNQGRVEVGDGFERTGNGMGERSGQMIET